MNRPMQGSIPCMGFHCSTSSSMNNSEPRSVGASSLGAEVRSFYERHPYPPPVDSLEKYRLLGQDPQKRRADHHLFWPARPFRQDHSILIAGCGTSQAAKHALRWPAAQVTAIDFSATSVHCTEELKRKYDLKNLQVFQLSIERVRDLKMSFDQVICTGVLHHLADPDAGLAALRDVLAPDGGAMLLMVYAPYGRTGVYMLQDLCKRIGIPATDDGIRDLIELLKALPRGHPLENLLREVPDLRDEAALADALLHPRDRAYSVPQLFDFIHKAGLTFGRWLKQAPYTPQCGVVATIPQAPRLAELSLADQYAAVELFRGTMVRHSVIAYRDDSALDARQIGFAGDAWLAYVPLRMPDTICVEKGLPPGAAAVLINPTHAYRDLFLAVDSTEKRWFDAIDGNRSIREIVDSALASSPDRPKLDKARTFVEGLWRYDQIVFDATPGRARKEDV